MIAKTIFSLFPCGAVIIYVFGVVIISYITSYCFFKKADLLVLHRNSTLQ